MWVRRTLAFICVLVPLVFNWGTVIDRGGSRLSEPEGFFGLQAVVQQVFLAPGLVVFGTIAAWVVYGCVLALLMNAGKVKRQAGWDIGLLGVWAVAGSTWTQVLMVSEGSLVSRFDYVTLASGFWIFFGGLALSICIRFFEWVVAIIVSFP